MLKLVQHLTHLSSSDHKLIQDMYHETLLENAINSITNKQNKHYHYVEEFLANTIYLLELGFEQEAQIQLEMVEYILLKEQDQDQ